MAQNGALGPAPASKHFQLASSLAGAPAHLPGQREAHSSSEAGVGGREDMPLYLDVVVGKVRRVS